MNEPQRICSLLPSATEIVYALGLGDRLVGVTHECDFPSDARSKPRVTSSLIDSEGLAAREIDEAVRGKLAEQATIYHLDRDLLESLQPDLILTQDLCRVCAVGNDDVLDVTASLRRKPQVVSLEPQTLDEVLDSILLVGCRTGVLSRAIDFVEALRRRLESVRDAVEGYDPIPVLTLEWTDPPFTGGHWVPEMVAAAGGRDVLGVPGEASREVTWQEIAAGEPEVVVAMPCGFGLERSLQEMRSARFPEAWFKLPAVKHDQVFVVDGSSYFNRPGPRLVDGVEVLAGLIHPDTRIPPPRGSIAQFSLRRQTAAAL